MQSADVTLTLIHPEVDGDVNLPQIHIGKSKFANMWARLDVLGHIFLLLEKKINAFSVEFSGALFYSREHA